VLAITACNSIPTTQQECEKQVTIYERYLLLVEKGEFITPEYIERAKLAAEFLRATCGWLPVAKHKALGVRDENGVPFVVRPL